MEKKRTIILSYAFILLLFSAFFLFSKTGFNVSPTGFSIYQEQSTSGTDTYIRQGSDNNYATQPTLKIGKNLAGVEFRSLIKFDLSSIPQGDTITNSVMSLYLSSATNTNNITADIYLISNPWINSEVGWNNRNSLTPWDSSGGDYSTKITSLQISNTPAWYNFTITTAVRNWITSGNENLGIIILSPDATTGNSVDFASSDNPDTSKVPSILVDYTSNAPPQIDSISADSSLSSPKQIGQSITFTINWTDLEGNSAEIFICNSSDITTSGCSQKTFCSTSSSTSPSQCSYTTQTSDNRTTQFFAAACDAGNCSSISESSFYVNHLPSIKIVQPNGGETLNQSQGNYSIKFNSSDSDNDALTAKLYYGSSQFSTENLISSLNLASYCTPVKNNCTYSWNSLGIYGTYYLTIIINDSFSTSQNSSSSSFNVRSLIDTTPPQIESQSIGSDIFSGKNSTISAEIIEPNINTVWAVINTTSETIVILTNHSGIFEGNFIAGVIGNYQFKVYANDTIGNLNDSMSWQEFNIRKPQALSQNELSPPIALPYNTIQITTELNATDSLKNVYAYLNLPSGFSLVSGYSQNNYLGNFSLGETKKATWLITTPLTESSYTLNATYTDAYSNSWNSSNMALQVTSAVGGYSLALSGYPETTVNKPYYAEASFTQSSVYVNPDSIKVSLYDPIGNLVIGPIAMSLKQTGNYNYTYNVPAGATAGLWQTIVNASKNSVNYISGQYWNLVGALFDVANVTVINSNVNSLDISVDTVNKGQGEADLTLQWNLTRVDNGQLLASDAETFAVSQSTITKHYYPKTDYIGQVKMTFLGRYSTTETAGAYTIFSTTPAETPITPPITGGSTGGGGGGPIIQTPISAPLMNISFDNNITLTKNIEKIIILKIINSGNTTLNNLILQITGINPEDYSISPSSILSITQGNSAEFKIKFLISDLQGEQDLSITIKSDEASKTINLKLNVLSMSDYFAQQLAQIYSRINLLMPKANDNQKQELSICKQTADSANQSLQKEEFINTQNFVKEADTCVSNVEDEINNVKSLPFTGIKMADYWVWIITWGLIALLIVVLIAIVYILWKKIGVASFIRNEGSVLPQEKPKLERDFINKKIKDIQEELDR
jgi:hypothetical protein